LTVQLIYGAFMAGLHAASFAPSWPSINGAFLPRDAFDSWTSAFNDPITVHFIHRNLAYLMGVLVFIDWIRRRSQSQRGPMRWLHPLPLGAVTVQLALGVATVLGVTDSNSFVPLAAAHQLGAVALMVSLILVGYFSPQGTPSPNVSFELGMAENP
jgi:cytochrome c oxidase assembly protein subunit 15